MLLRLTGPWGAVAVIAALGAVIPSAAEAQQSIDREPPASPRRNSNAPKPGEPGLWETVLIARLRASHPKENAWFQNAPRSELDKAGDYKYYLGVPMKLQECTTTSPIEESLRKWESQCSRQIKAQRGACEASDVEPTMSEPRETHSWISGNYRSELHIKNRVFQGKDSNGKQVYDDAETHIRYLGPCTATMRPGDRYLVGDDGHLVKQ